MTLGLWGVTGGLFVVLYRTRNPSKPSDSGGMTIAERCAWLAYFGWAGWLGFALIRGSLGLRQHPDFAGMWTFWATLACLFFGPWLVGLFVVLRKGRSKPPDSGGDPPGQNDSR